MIAECDSMLQLVVVSMNFATFLRSYHQIGGGNSSSILVDDSQHGKDESERESIFDTSEALLIVSQSNLSACLREVSSFYKRSIPSSGSFRRTWATRIREVDRIESEPQFVATQVVE